VRTTKIATVISASLMVAAASAPLAFGQSLAEVAQKERERKAAAKKTPVRTYGDQDLAGYAGERPAEGTPADETPATSATPDATPPATEADTAGAPEKNETATRAPEEEAVRARWREATQRVSAAEQRLAQIEEEMKTLPPGLPAGNYPEDIRLAVEQQKAEREQRLALAKTALATAKEAQDAVEVEARRKSIRLD